MTDSTVVLFSIVFDYDNFSITTAGLFNLVFIVLVLISVGFIGYRHFKGHGRVRDQKIELSFAGQKYSYTIQRSSLNIEIAYRIYIELITRKAAIPFDDDNDVVSEVYDSWYRLFGVVRDEIKKLDSDLLLNSKRSRELVVLTTDILNKGLRPHLTLYQGRMRKWLSENKDPGLSPQELQRGFPAYGELVQNLKSVNVLLVNYSEQLKLLIYTNDA